MDVSSGTNSLEFSQNKVFPNPSTSGLFSVENIKRKTVLIEVYDQTGRLVLSKMDDNSLLELDLSDQNNGIYNLIISYDSNVFHHRIISNR